MIGFVVFSVTLSIFAVYLSCKLYGQTLDTIEELKIEWSGKLLRFVENTKDCKVDIELLQKRIAYLQDQITNLRSIVTEHVEPASLTFGDLSQFDLFTAGDDDILRKRICGDGNCFSIESGVYYGLSDSLPVTRMYADFASLE